MNARSWLLGLEAPVYANRAPEAPRSDPDEYKFSRDISLLGLVGSKDIILSDS